MWQVIIEACKILKYPELSEIQRDYFEALFDMLCFVWFQMFSETKRILYCMVWYRMVWHRMVWYGIVWYRIVSYRIVSYCIVMKIYLKHGRIISIH